MSLRRRLLLLLRPPAAVAVVEPAGDQAGLVPTLEQQDRVLVLRSQFRRGRLLHGADGGGGAEEERAAGDAGREAEVGWRRMEEV